MTTILAFHAHPDDEVLLTGGTLARLAAEGHRVVVAVACDGIMGDATGPDGTLRLDELRASAAILGVARVVHLGYADSGHGPLFFPDPPDRVRFARADLDEAASLLADLLREERVDVLLSYDAQGGYGHRDHVRVHEVGARAARLTGTRVLEATRPREPTHRLFRTLRFLRTPVRYDPEAIRTSYTPRSAITHRINVRPYAAQKRAALAAHRSQVAEGKGRSSALFRLLIRLPVPIFGLLLGREWFAEAGLAPGAGRSGDLLGVR
ncbi:PIG-L deacetylase family protein [Streptomyces sp. RKAG293]|uniref:PIG-L deacetylase family protein n=1 Tax=Streptomyces sp. RKAG293 TaxID=2893403 RepID=UPI0020343847|nr:PIG-L family deacetylase [Streptomyces sp. RKAG293]MCM2420157.1 PIG-L family deacetylase [Streptomyces sp. RKAG293]